MTTESNRPASVRFQRDRRRGLHRCLTRSLKSRTRVGSAQARSSRGGVLLLVLFQHRHTARNASGVSANVSALTQDSSPDAAHTFAVCGRPATQIVGLNAVPPVLFVEPPRQLSPSLPRSTAHRAHCSLSLAASALLTQRRTRTRHTHTLATGLPCGALE